MVTDGLLKWLGDMVTLLTSWLPADPPPPWFADASTYLGQIWSYGQGLGAWIPWDAIGYVLPVVLSSMVLGFTIKVVRIVASFFTLGGGSAA